ncbi:MAG TPA: hypothetical protein VKZ53_02855 [Candidatus Angelobacter sp.]|nr:hypothetical protein [Candidatus Angelobacter sp.]
MRQIFETAQTINISSMRLPGNAFADGWGFGAWGPAELQDGRELLERFKMARGRHLWNQGRPRNWLKVCDLRLMLEVQ